MSGDAANARELAGSAGEIGADVLSGDLRLFSEIGGWLPGNLDLSEHLHHHSDCLAVAALCRKRDNADDGVVRPHLRSKTELCAAVCHIIDDEAHIMPE